MQNSAKTPAAITATSTAPKPEAKRAPKPKQQAAAKAPKADKAAERAALAKRIESESKTAFTLFTKLSSESVSIPIKPLAGFKAYNAALAPTFTGAKPTPRRAAAVYIAALASGVTVKNGATFPRKFKMRGADYCLDNGAVTRCTQAGLITYDAKSETCTIANATAVTSAIRTTGFKL